MKKAVWISGILSALFLPFLITGAADRDGAVRKALLHGNELYSAARYEEAQQAYGAGLSASPENKALRLNAAQAALVLNDYEQAITHYEQADSSIAKYLNTGNANIWLGEAASDPNQELQYYVKALQALQEGIEHFPQDMPLKYNYETVRRKLEELAEDAKQDGGDQDESEGDRDNRENQSQSESENESSQDQESQDEDTLDTGQSEGSDSGQGEEQSSVGGQPDATDKVGEEREQNLEAIGRILQILEDQEAESLRNNQSVVGGKDGENGW